MTLGAYRETAAFSYPGWRLTVPGGPAGGHNKGFTHTESAGTTILPQDQYEEDRGEGMSSHDTVHTHQHSPRGVYRSSGEVPPRPNASGAAHTYRGYQTQRHAGTSVAPGSYPADFFETGEDSFLDLAENAVHYLKPEDAMGFLSGPEIVVSGGGDGIVPPGFVCPPNADCSGIISPRRFPVPPAPSAPNLPPGFVCPPNADCSGLIPSRPNTVACSEMIQYVPPGYQRVQTGTDANGCPIMQLAPIPGGTLPAGFVCPPNADCAGLPGATSTVPQPAGGGSPLPPAPSIPVATAPPVSPTPGPIVATNEVVPLNDGSGNYINLSTGQIIPASAVTQNPATGQLIASSASSAISWLEQPSSFFPSLPNWGLLAIGVGAAAVLMGKHR